MNLKKINEPIDLKQMNEEQLIELSNDLRAATLHRLEKKGGHSGPNLGVIELTIALHYVFNLPEDKLIFDISHQTYAHKMLTGRYKLFVEDLQLTGFTNPDESSHDHFKVGHTSTAISLGVGMAKARDLCKRDENVISIIGDGSLGGGIALEGLSNAGALNSNLIIVINDNDQSIAENHGGLYENLRELRQTNGTCQTNIFKAMNLDYLYVEAGHDIMQLITTFNQVKNTNKPIVVHIHTIKGKGYEPAENNHEKYHSGGPIDVKTGKYKVINPENSYTSELAKQLKTNMEKHDSVAVITAGTPITLGFNAKMRAEFPNQFIDTGITEAHALTMSASMARNGAKPVFGVSSSFLQRAYDQLIHDVAINRLPVTILVYMNGVNGFKDVTHLGFYDIPMLINIPNMIYLAPTNLKEQRAMVDYAIHQTEHPIAIRVPMIPLTSTDVTIDQTDYSQINKYEVQQEGINIALIGVGGFNHLAVAAAEIIQEQSGIKPTVINPKFISGIDQELMANLIQNHSLIITIEDGQIAGGFGAMVATHLSTTDVKVKNLGISKEFVDCFDISELMEKEGLHPQQIADYAILNQ